MWTSPYKAKFALPKFIVHYAAYSTGFSCQLTGIKIHPDWPKSLLRHNPKRAVDNVTGQTNLMETVNFHPKKVTKGDHTSKREYGR
jgi:hypothetical protein